VVSTAASYAGGPELKSQPENGYSDLKLGHDSLVSNPNLSFTGLSFLHSTLHSLSYWKSVVK
jgi:hypothetical protein